MRQFLSLVCLLSIYITAVSGSVDFYCFEEGIKINCTDRKEVDLYDFDNSITDFNSNRYYTNTYSDGFTAIFFDITAYSTDINIDSETGSVTFSGENNYETIYIINIESTSEGAGNELSNTYDSESSSLFTYQTAFYEKKDTTISGGVFDSSIVFSEKGSQIYKIYSLKNKSLTLTNTDKFTITKDSDLSYISFGTKLSPCEFEQSVSLSQFLYNEDYEIVGGEYTFTLSFDKCNIIIQAVDPETDEVYLYTADIDNKTFTFPVDSSTTSYGDIELIIYNLEYQEVGYLQYNFYTSEFKVLDLNREPFQ